MRSDRPFCIMRFRLRMFRFLFSPDSRTATEHRTYFNFKLSITIVIWYSSTLQKKPFHETINYTASNLMPLGKVMVQLFFRFWVPGTDQPMRPLTQRESLIFENPLPKFGLIICGAQNRFITDWQRVNIVRMLVDSLSLIPGGSSIIPFWITH